MSATKRDQWSFKGHLISAVKSPDILVWEKSGQRAVWNIYRYTEHGLGCQPAGSRYGEVDRESTEEASNDDTAKREGEVCLMLKHIKAQKGNKVLISAEEA